MTYNLIITERAEELLDQLVYHLLFVFKNEQAAKHFLDEVSKIYARLESNPYQFPESDNLFLKQREYREAVLTTMNYLIVFKVEANTVYIMGIFHEQENYEVKI